MYSWREQNTKRFYGLDLKTNVVDVMDGRCLDANNVYLSSNGVISKRPGNEVMFEKPPFFSINTIGTCTLNGVKYYFVFAEVGFYYSTSLTGALNLVPIFDLAFTNLIWWAVIDDKLYFVDGLNALRFFNGTTIQNSSIYLRPTVALTGGAGTGFDFSYTVDNGLGESPVVSTLLLNKGSGSTVVVAGNTGPQTLVVGDKIRIYSKSTTVAAASKNVTPTSGAHANGTYGEDESGGYLLLTSTAASYSIVTVAISDTTPQLYSELGIALNKSAPVGLQGITVHYGRLVGWKDSYVYNSKVTNPDSWPDDQAQHNAFVYGFGVGDGESISVCKTFKDNLFVMKPSDAAIFGGIGPDDTGNNAYSFTRLETNGDGCIAGKSAVTIGEDNNLVLVFLSKNGFKATNGAEPYSVGEEISPVIRNQSASNQALSEAIYDKRLGLYLCAFGSAENRTIWVLDVRPDTVAGQQILFGWFPWRLTGVKCLYFDSDRVLFGQYDGFSVSQRVSGTSSDYSDTKYESFVSGDVSVANDTIEVATIYETGEPISITPDLLSIIPGGIVQDQTYYAIYVDDTHIKLATSPANAETGTAINITDQGTNIEHTGPGTYALYGRQAISAYYTTNWMSMGKPLAVKKLGKLGIIFNAVASEVGLRIQSAYNWTPAFVDSFTFLSSPNAATWGGAGSSWGPGLPWGTGQLAEPINYALPRRKCRSIQFKFSNDTIDQDFSLQALYLPFAYIRNRGKFQ